MKRVVILSEDEYDDILRCVHRIITELQNIRDCFSRTEIMHQVDDVAKILVSKENNHDEL